MAGVRGTVKFKPTTLGDVDQIVFLQVIAASNHRVRIERITFSYTSATAAEACHFNLGLVTTPANTFHATTNVVGPTKVNTSDNETLTVTASGWTAGGVADTIATYKGGTTVGANDSVALVYPPDRPLFIKGGETLCLLATQGATGGIVGAVVEFEE